MKMKTLIMLGVAGAVLIVMSKKPAGADCGCH